MRLGVDLTLSITQARGFDDSQTSMIPKNIDEASADWLSDVMGANIATRTPTQIGQGVGIMGDIFKVTLDYAEADAAGPQSVVVKLPSSFEENRTQGVALGMFEAEVRFYNELAHNVSVGLPKVYRAEIESGTADFVIVMEDLSHFSLVDQSAGMSANQAFDAVRVLAHVHAVWWDKAKDESLEWIPSMVGPRIAFVDELLPQLLPPFLAGFGDALTSDGQALYERFAGNYLKVNQTLAGRSPWTLVHQDYRVENLMFGEPESGDVVVLDWQGIGRGPGSYDLAYILGGSMQPEVRRANETELLDAYHRQLVELGVSAYSREQLADDYALSQLQGGLATAMVVCGGMDLSNERGRELGTTMATRHATAALDHNGLELLNQIVG